MSNNCCKEVYPDREQCSECRTINLGRVKEAKPNMEIYDKCATPQIQPSASFSPPTSIRVCNKEDLRGYCPQAQVIDHYPWTHGKFMYGVKAALLAAAFYFTYRQGVWGGQPEVEELMKRWRQYILSLSTRDPPVFDRCGKICNKKTKKSPLDPFKDAYKYTIMSVCSALVKVPMFIKCTYLDYMAALEQKEKMKKK